MTDTLQDLLSECYFVIPFVELQAALPWPESALRQALQQGLQHGYIHQYHFDEQAREYMRLDAPDLASLAASAFLATRTGLMALHMGK